MKESYKKSESREQKVRNVFYGNKAHYQMIGYYISHIIKLKGSGILIYIPLYDTLMEKAIERLGRDDKN